MAKFRPQQGRTYRRGVVGGALVALTALSAAACGGGGGTSTPSGSSSAGVSSFNAASTSVVNPSTATGGTLRLSASGDCDSWDPARTYYAWCWDMQRLQTRSLMAYQGQPGKAGSTVVPDLAQAPGVSNATATQWTYKLKPGLKFSDGTTITSKDIKYGIERIFATDVINGGPTYLLCLLSTCDATGAPAYPGPYKDKSAAGLTSIATPDDQTITFNLTSPFADFNYLMAIPDSAPVPAAKDTSANYQLKPVSSGPFVMSAYSQGKSATWVRNTYWSQSTDTVRHPLVNQVTLTINSNPEDADLRLQSGDIDLEADGGVQSAFQSKIIASPALKKYSDNPITGFTRYLAIMQSVPPLDNVHCRRAVLYATNKSDLRLARGGEYGGQFANTMTPPNIPGAPVTENPYPTGATYTGDLAKAKSELAACGKPNGFSVNMAYVPAGRAIPIYNAMQQSLGRVGITVNGLTNPQSSYYSTFIGSPANVKSKGIGIALAGWAADFPSAYGFWYAIADGKAIQPQGNSNYPSLNDPVVNNLLTQATQTTDAAGQQQIVAKIDNQVMSDAVYLPFVFDKMLSYRNPRLTNIYIQAAFGYYDYVNVGVGGGA
ncbi:MAG: ABC transporter substrate-binding protein [Actinomycetes bacterium]